MVSIKSSDLSSVEEKTQHLKRFSGQRGNVEDNVYMALEITHYRDFIELWKNKAGKLHLSIVSIDLIVWNSNALHMQFYICDSLMNLNLTILNFLAWILICL